ncbi:MAG: membrane protein insertion efficiency factor YidD [Pyrinomonadaceae bacterium]|nr:membrane protein insertion efficiency factor YidD [Pyrinomonadaceae bacterium]
MQFVLLKLLKFYKLAISPYLPRACRFEPTCSVYAMQAIQKHGAFRGLTLAVWRILRCQPFCRGGYDPIP